MGETVDIDTFRQNAIVEDDKLLVGVFTPGIEGVKELLTIDLGLVDISTILAGDVENIVTTFLQLMHDVSLKQHSTHHFARRGRYKDLRGACSIKRVYHTQKHVTVVYSGICTLLTLKVNLKGDDSGRKDAATLDQFRSRDVAKNLAIDLTIVHATISATSVLRCGSEEVRCISSHAGSSDTNKMITLHSIMRLIKITAIDVDTSIDNTGQRMIGGEDDHMLTNVVTHTNKQVDTIRLGCLEMCGLTTMNVQDVSIIYMLKILGRQLSSEHNARRNNNNSLRSFCGSITTNSILDSNQRLATTSRHQDLTLVSSQHSIESTLLVGTELHSVGLSR